MKKIIIICFLVFILGCRNESVMVFHVEKPNTNIAVIGTIGKEYIKEKIEGLPQFKNHKIRNFRLLLHVNFEEFAPEDYRTLCLAGDQNETIRIEYIDSSKYVELSRIYQEFLSLIF